MIPSFTDVCSRLWRAACASLHVCLMGIELDFVAGPESACSKAHRQASAPGAASARYKRGLSCCSNCLRYSDARCKWDRWWLQRWLPPAHRQQDHLMSGSPQDPNVGDNSSWGDELDFWPVASSSLIDPVSVVAPQEGLVHQTAVVADVHVPVSSALLSPVLYVPLRAPSPEAFVPTRRPAPPLLAFDPTLVAHPLDHRDYPPPLLAAVSSPVPIM